VEMILLIFENDLNNSKIFPINNLELESNKIIKDA